MADNHDIEGFLSYMGFDNDCAVPCYNVQFNYLNIDSRIKQLSIPLEIYSLKDIPGRIINLFNDSLAYSEEFDQLSYMIKSPLSVYDEYSLCYIRNDQIVACILLENSSKSDVISIDSVYSKSDAVRELATLWAALYRRLSEKYPNGKDVLFSSFDQIKNNAIMKLFSDVKTETVHYNEIQI